MCAAMDDPPPRNVAELLIESKDLSELMVDLAFASVYFDDEEYRRLKAIARERNVAPAQVLREAVAEYTARHAPARRPSSIGRFRSGRPDLSERAERLLKGFGRS